MTEVACIHTRAANLRLSADRKAPLVISTHAVSPHRSPLPVKACPGGRITLSTNELRVAMRGVPENRNFDD